MFETLVIPILLALFGGISVFDLADRIRYRKQHAQLKETDVKDRELDIQAEEINLAEMYRTKMLEQLTQQEEMLKKQWEAQNIDNKKVLETLLNVCNRLAVIETRIGDIEGFLNGDLRKYKSEHHKD